VFYDTGEGQARVLGGGFIQSAVAATRVPPVREARVASGTSRL
jgi:tRNA-uridine 2-sulfurtransferase